MLKINLPRFNCQKEIAYFGILSGKHRYCLTVLFEIANKRYKYEGVILCM